MRILDRIFASGPRQDIDRALTPEGAVFRVQDGRPRSGGAWGKRPAYWAINRTASDYSEDIFNVVPTAIGEFANRDALAAGGRVWTRDREGFVWSENGRAGVYIPRTTHWVQFNDVNESSVRQQNLAAVNGLICVAFTFQLDPTVWITDFQAIDGGGNRIFGMRFIGEWQPRLIVIGTNVFFFSVDRATRNVTGRLFNTTTRVMGSPVTYAAVFATPNFAYDVSLLGSGMALAIPISTTNILVGKLNAAGVSLGTNTISVPFGVACLKATVYGSSDGGIIYLGAFQGQSYTGTMLASTMAVISAMSALPVPAGTTGSEPYYTERSSGSVWAIWRFRAGGLVRAEGLAIASRTPGAAPADTLNVHHVQPASRPFNGTTDRFEIWLHTDNGEANADNIVTGQSAWAINRRFALCSLSKHVGASFSRFVVHPELVPDERSHWQDTEGVISVFGVGPWLPDIGSLNGQFYFSALTPLRTQTSRGNRPEEASALIVYQWQAVEQHSMLLAGGVGAVLGGHMQEIMSSRLQYAPDIGYAGPTPLGAENGFIRAPAILDYTSATGAGGLTEGVHQLCVTYEYIDADGRRHRSPPSNIVAVTFAPGVVSGAITIEIAGYSAFEREVCSTAHQTAIHVWATAVNGETFFRISNDQNTLAAYTDDYKIDFVHTEPVIGGEILYTDGAVYPIQPAPAHRFGCLAGDRLVLGGGFDPRIVEVSRYFRPRQPAEFTRADPFRAVLPEACTGLGYLDGQIVAFTERGIYLIDAGQLPNDQGFPALRTPVPLPTDVGCREGSPIVQLSSGLIFESRRGIYLLPRGFGPPRYLSGPVKEDLRGRRVYSTALVHYAAESPSGDRELAGHYLYLGVGAPDSFVIDYGLILDADSLAWVGRDKWHNPRVIGAWDGKAALARSPIVESSDFVHEVPVSFLDAWAANGDPSPRFYIETGEIRPFGFSGRGRVHAVRMLGQYVTECAVTLLTVPDGRVTPTYQQPTLPLTNADNLPTDRLTVEFTPRPEGTEVNSVSYRLQVDQLDPDDIQDSEGILIHGIAFLVEPLPAFKGLPASKRV